MTSSLILSPMAHLPVLIALAIAALLAIAIGARRRPAGAALRALAAIALFGLILDPALQVKEETPLADVAVVLTDRSLSQSLDGRDAVAERLNETLTNALRNFDNVDVIEADIAGEEETAIGAALAAAVGGVGRGRLAGVFVISDGQSSDRPDPALLPEEAAFHLLLTGRTNEVDRRITLLNAPRYGIVNDSVEISFRIDDVGPEGVRAEKAPDPEIILRLNGTEIARQTAPTEREISFSAPLERPGKSVIELVVAPRPGELSEANNTAVLPIEAIRDRLRVMLISGEPHNGERVWRNLLKSDPAIDLVHFTILRPAEKQAADGFIDQRELALIEFPQDELFIKKIDEFDLIVFDRYTYRGVLNAYHFENIARYVEDGGAVLVASGPEFAGENSLAARYNFSYLLPAIPTGPTRDGAFRPQINTVGERHPVTADLSDADYWGRWLRAMPAARRGGRTLMEDEKGAPLLVLDRVKKGRVGVLLSDQVWLWARGFDGGGPHGELLRRIAHWLMREPELEEEQLQIYEAGGGLIVERRTLENETAPVEITAPDGAITTLPLRQIEDGLFQTQIETPQKGLYRARDGELFAIGAFGLAAPPEFADVVMDSGPLAPLAEKTGGGVFSPRGRAVNAEGVRAPGLRRINAGASDKAGAAWAGLPRRRASVVEAVKVAPLAPPLAYLAAIALAILGAWFLEGRTRNNRTTSSEPRQPSGKTS
ncbi:MAG: hypothetical protein AAF224_11140 [Pseudomonadota bacterium]